VYGFNVQAILSVLFLIKERLIPMQAGLAASQPLWNSMRRLFRLDRRSEFSFHVKAAKSLAIAMLVVISSFSNSFSNSGYCVEPAQPDLQKLFHLVGVPGLRRDQRVNLAFDADGLSFQASKVQYQVPYARIHQVLLLNSDRRYEGRTYAAALATYGVGALLILKKHHVDTVVLDYVNERGGKMGIVLQMETSQGEVFKNLMESRNVSVEEPEAASDISKQPTTTNTSDRSKQ
jgi:hypothetical protein